MTRYLHGRPGMHVCVRPSLLVVVALLVTAPTAYAAGASPSPASGGPARAPAAGATATAARPSTPAAGPAIPPGRAATMLSHALEIEDRPPKLDPGLHLPFLGTSRSSTPIYGAGGVLIGSSRTIVTRSFGSGRSVMVTTRTEGGVQRVNIEKFDFTSRGPGKSWTRDFREMVRSDGKTTLTSAKTTGGWSPTRGLWSSGKAESVERQRTPAGVVSKVTARVEGTGSWTNGPSVRAVP